MIAKRADFLKLVRDIKDRHALGGQFAQRREQDIYFLRGQHAGRLVHDQKPGVLQQTADDLDALPLSGREIAHRAVRIKRQAIGLRDIPDTGGEVAQGGGVFHAKGNILGHAHRVKQREMLKHHRHPGGAGRARFGRGIGRAMQGHGSAIGGDKPIDHLDQRRFPGAVFAQQGVHLAFADRKRHRVIGDNPGVGLGQTFDIQKLPCHAALSPGCSCLGILAMVGPSAPVKTLIICREITPALASLSGLSSFMRSCFCSLCLHPGQGSKSLPPRQWQSSADACQARVFQSGR